MRFYGELATWWPQISPTEDYEEEAGEIARLLGDVGTVLELGAGGGSNAFHLKDRYALTLSDLSAEMLAVSRAAEPGARARPGRHAHAAAGAHVRRRARPRRDRLHDHRGRPARGAGHRVRALRARRAVHARRARRDLRALHRPRRDGRRALPRVDLRPRPVRHLDGHRVRLRAARRRRRPHGPRDAPHGPLRPRDVAAGCCATPASATAEAVLEQTTEDREPRVMFRAFR